MSLKTAALVALLAAANPALQDAAKPHPVTKANESHYDKAYIAYRKDDYALALQHIDRAIAEDSTDADFWNFKALTLGHMKRHPESLKAAEKAVELRPDDGEMYSTRGTCHYFLDDREAAVRDYDRALRLDYVDANFYKNYMDVLTELKRFEEVKPLYALYLEHRNNDPDEMDEMSDIPFYASLAYLATGDNRRSIELINEAIRINPDFAGYYINRGSAYDNLEAYTKALDDYGRAIHWYPDDPNAYFNRGVTLLTLERNEEALRDFRKANELGQDDVDVWLNIGASLRALKRNDEALAAYDRALKHDPNHAKTRANRATLLDDLKRPGEAQQDRDIATPGLTTEETAKQYFNQSLDRLETEEYLLMIELLEKAIALKPDFYQAWSNLAMGYQRMHQPDRAMNALDRAIDAMPNNVTGYLNRALLNEELGNITAAIRDARTAVNVAPDDYMAKVRLALYLSHADQAKEANDIYSALDRSGQAPVDAYINYTSFLLDESRYREAMAVGERGLRRFPDDRRLLNNFASAQSDSGDDEEAVQTYDKLIAQNPDYAAAYFNLGNHYMIEMKQYDKAIVNYEKALEIDSQLSEVWLNLASAYDSAAQRNKAIGVLDKAAKLFPDQYEIIYNRAGLYSSDGKFDQAKRDYREALKRAEKTLAAMDAARTPERLETMGYQAYMYSRLGDLRKADTIYSEVVALLPNDVKFLSNYGFLLLDLQKPEKAEPLLRRAFVLDPDEVDHWIGLMAVNYLLGQYDALNSQKQDFIRTFQGKYELNLNLTRELATKEYYFTDAFEKVWRNLMLVPTTKDASVSPAPVQTPPSNSATR